MYQKDVIVKDSDKSFRLRISGYLCGIGVSQIIGTKEYLEIVFIGGEFSVRVLYPTKLEELVDVLKTELLSKLKTIQNKLIISGLISETISMKLNVL